MGWTLAGPAVEIHASVGAPLQATSTSTVRLGPRDLDGGAARLRMFGVDDVALGRALPDRRAWGRLVGPNPCGMKERVITYLDSGVASGMRRLLAPFRFAIGAPGGAPLSSTCVPSQRRAVAWPQQPREGNSETRTGGLQTPSVDVTYKDVSVLRLPDQTWLMVLARYRILAADPPLPAFPGGSIGDVIAWRALDPAFTQGLTGPHWLVDGRDALPDEARPAWLGVPAAIVTGEGEGLRVDVYYVVEPDEPAPRQGPDPARLASGVAVKRFAWDTLLGHLVAPAPPEVQAPGALPGELLGRLRVWAASGGEGEARPLETAYDGADVRLVDPAPFACADRPSLFLAAINATGPFAEGGAWGGHGVWRAAGLPTGASICSVPDVPGACTPTPTVEGRDFVVSAGGAGSPGGSPDRLVVSGGSGIYVDPDPVRLPGGGVRVAVGSLGAARRPRAPDDGNPGPEGLTWVAGAPKDACRPWTDAWRR
ncbi:MAG: hypothetical protein Q8P18_17465 [Pseudomonadota bacterium]|nr:hypothetical protein [Pseudomonadota bacterium]